MLYFCILLHCVKRGTRNIALSEFLRNYRPLRITTRNQHSLWAFRRRKRTSLLRKTSQRCHFQKNVLCDIAVKHSVMCMSVPQSVWSWHAPSFSCVVCLANTETRIILFLKRRALLALLCFYRAFGGGKTLTFLALSTHFPKVSYLTLRGT
jgi:hypothetical protein